MEATPHSMRSAEEKVNLLDYGGAVWRHRRLAAIVWLTLVVSVAVYSLVARKVYEGTVALLAPQEEGSSGLIGGLLAGGQLGMPIGAFTSNKDMLIGILNSRTIAQATVEKYKLRERYEVDYMQDAIKKLQDDMLKVDIAREGVIALTIRDWDRHLAAEMANFYVNQADRIVSLQGRSEAGRQRAFIEKQLVGTKASLARAEDALRRFQEVNRAIGLVDQTRGAIDAAARLKGEVIASEVQLQVMRGFATEANPDVAALRKRIEEMKRQLTQVQYGDNLVEQSRPDFQVPFTKVPHVGLELIRLTRDVKVEETVMTLLTQQYEQSRISEAKDLPIVQVLDVAVPADRHARPRLLLNVAVAAVLAMILAVTIALAVDYTQMTRAARAPQP